MDAAQKNAATLFSKIKEYLQDHASGILSDFQGLTEWGKTGLNIWAGVEKFKMARFQEQFQKDMAAMSKNLATLESISALMENLKGADLTEVMQDVVASAQNQADFFTKFLELVDSFIQNASFRMSELANKGVAYAAG